MKAKKSKASTTKVSKRKSSKVICDGEILLLESALSVRDLEQLERYVSSVQVQSKLGEAVLHDSTVAQYKSRRCFSAWISLSKLPAHRKFRAAVKAAQDQFEVLPRTRTGALRCTYEDVQYCEYRGEQGGHFKEWHVDADDGGHDAEDAREITIVALLAEPNSDFLGGEFQATTDSYPHGAVVSFRKGDIIAFRAKHLWHRVLPTTQGIRKTIVLWAKNPNHRAHPSSSDDDDDEDDDIYDDQDESSI